LGCTLSWLEYPWSSRRDRGALEDNLFRSQLAGQALRPESRGALPRIYRYLSESSPHPQRAAASSGGVEVGLQGVPIPDWDRNPQPFPAHRAGIKPAPTPEAVASMGLGLTCPAMPVLLRRGQESLSRIQGRASVSEHPLVGERGDGKGPFMTFFRNIPSQDEKTC